MEYIVLTPRHLRRIPHIKINKHLPTERPPSNVELASLRFDLEEPYGSCRRPIGAARAVPATQMLDPESLEWVRRITV